jgi:hypothetical protein
VHRLGARHLGRSGAMVATGGWRRLWGVGERTLRGMPAPDRIRGFRNLRAGGAAGRGQHGSRGRGGGAGEGRICAPAGRRRALLP